MRSHRSILIIGLAAILLMTVSPAMGQIIYGQPASGSLRMIYSNWSIEDDSAKTDINQFMIPIGGFVPLQDNMEFRFFAANANNKVESGEYEYTMSGMSDVRLQFNSSFSDDQFLLSAGLNLPTGKKKLSHEEEQPVMTVLTQNYLSFPIRRLGEGFGFNLLAGVAAASGNSRFGATAMYHVNGSYEAYEGDGDYTPGNMLSLSANADTRWDNFALLGDVTFATFTADKLEDKKVFKQSKQVELHAGAVYGMETYGFEGDIRFLIRDRNESYGADETVDYRLKVYGNEIFVGGRFAYHPQETWYVAPTLEFRSISSNELPEEKELGSAGIAGFGLEYGRTFSENLDFGVGFKYFTGSADGGDLDLSGFRLSANLQTAF